MTGRNVAVIGGGTMGIGIAYRFAVADSRVYLVDLDLEHAERSVGRVTDALARAVGERPGESAVPVEEAR